MAQSTKRGRPPVNNPKRHQYRIRLTVQEKKELKELATRLNLSEAEVIRAGIALISEREVNSNE